MYYLNNRLKVFALFCALIFSQATHAYNEYCWGVDTSKMVVNVPSGSPIVGIIVNVQGYYSYQNRNIFVGKNGSESLSGCPNGSIPMSIGNQTMNFHNGGWFGTGQGYDFNRDGGWGENTGVAATIYRCWQDLHWEIFPIVSMCVSTEGAF